MTRPRQDVEPRRAVDLERLDPVALAAAISQLPPNHALVAAARMAAEVSEARHDRKVAVRDAGKDIAADKVWQGYSHRHLPHEEVARRRAEPGPMAQVPQPREAKECLQPDPTAAACAEARAATRDAVKAQEERAEQLNRWAANDAAANADDDALARF